MATVLDKKCPKCGDNMIALGGYDYWKGNTHVYNLRREMCFECSRRMCRRMNWSCLTMLVVAVALMVYLYGWFLPSLPT